VRPVPAAANKAGRGGAHAGDAGREREASCVQFNPLAACCFDANRLRRTSTFDRQTSTGFDSGVDISPFLRMMHVESTHQRRMP